MEKFEGPFFVIGMPRSGTKLLRDLLNRHPQISIPEVETGFFPALVKKYGKEFDFNAVQREELFLDFFKTPFYWDVKQIGFSINADFIQKQKTVTNWDEFGRLILGFFGPKSGKENIIIGDKTPYYVNHLSLLKSIWPSAKFIHIIRDPRDISISVKNIWNKNMFRAAYIWKNTLGKTTFFKELYEDDYIEIKYESLISEVESVMRELSSFLMITFHPSMCTLSKPAENYGDAKGKNIVVTNNKQKFLQVLSKSEIKALEELTYSEMIRLKYQPLYANEEKKATSLMVFSWLTYDAYSSIQFHIKEKGISQGLSYFFKWHMQKHIRGGE